MFVPTLEFSICQIEIRVSFGQPQLWVRGLRSRIRECFRRVVLYLLWCFHPSLCNVSTNCTSQCFNKEERPDRRRQTQENGDSDPTGKKVVDVFRPDHFWVTYECCCKCVSTTWTIVCRAWQLSSRVFIVIILKLASLVQLWKITTHIPTYETLVTINFS